MTNTILALLVPMLAVAASAQAQTSPDWTQKVKSGKTIFVTTLTGEQITGKAQAAGPGTITVSTATGRRIVSVADVQKVQKLDETWTGAAIGAGVGVLSIVTDPTLDDDPMIPEALNNTINAFAAAIAVTGCALVGWGIDALVKTRKTIYAADAPQPRSRVSLAINRRMVGVTIAFQP